MITNTCSRHRPSCWYVSSECFTCAPTAGTAQLIRAARQGAEREQIARVGERSRGGSAMRAGGRTARRVRRGDGYGSMGTTRSTSSAVACARRIACVNAWLCCNDCRTRRCAGCQSLQSLGRVRRTGPTTVARTYPVAALHESPFDASPFDESSFDGRARSPSAAREPGPDALGQVWEPALPPCRTYHRPLSYHHTST